MTCRCGGVKPCVRCLTIPASNGHIDIGKLYIVGYFVHKLLVVAPV